jgi:release factor glutamine methyltransferase
LDMAKTYNDLYIATRRQLRDAGISAFSLEARLLVACAAGKTTEKLLRDLMLYTSDDTELKLAPMVRRRLSGEPVAYITGEWEFYGIPIQVDRNVLIPRTDTELLVELAVKAARGKKMDARVLDLCCGSGCIGCAIAHELPASRVVMADISPEALSISRKNVQRNNLTPRVTCIEADALAAPPMLVGNFDLVVCNPPYIPTQDIPGLDGSVRDYEPLGALDGGGDGLDFYRAILKNWKGVLRHGGLMLFEVGIGQAEDVRTQMLMSGFLGVECIRDTGGIDRVVMGRI